MNIQYSFYNPQDFFHQLMHFINHAQHISQIMPSTYTFCWIQNHQKHFREDFFFFFPQIMYWKEDARRMLWFAHLLWCHEDINLLIVISPSCVSFNWRQYNAHWTVMDLITLFLRKIFFPQEILTLHGRWWLERPVNFFELTHLEICDINH